ncbi:MAG: M1 family metallopeptidase [Nitrospinota bacterium]
MTERCLSTLFITLLIFFLNLFTATAETIHHEIGVSLAPDAHTIQVSDIITIHLTKSLSAKKPIHALLHADLEIADPPDGPYSVTIAGKVELSHFGKSQEDVGLTEKRPLQELVFRWKQGDFWPETFKVSLKYKGIIYHPLETEDEAYARGFKYTSGIIDSKGVILSQDSYWYPWFGDYLTSFKMTVRLPEDWDAVSQGNRILHETKDRERVVVWDSPDLTDNIYIVAGPYTEYSRKIGDQMAYIFLRSPDNDLAERYIKATEMYLRMYNRLIGPYLYPKFAMVENFWETGFGMPSFTLLGPTVIHLPFILHTSYPHEILHNWWGNGVLLRNDTGNWCEGLTAYLADHLLKEGKGQGAEYRYSMLQKYTDYVSKEKDFPLNVFRERHSPASEAVGYGKAMMLFHMLRKKLGDNIFTNGLREFYSTYQLKQASFQDLRQSFEKVSGEDLRIFFHQWVDRVGAPVLKLGKIEVEIKGDIFLTHIMVRQIQEEKPYALEVPVVLSIEGEEKPRLFNLSLNSRSAYLNLELHSRPVWVAVDPNFDIFRRLERSDIPPSIGQTFGAGQSLIVLPSTASAEMLGAYRSLADLWVKKAHKNIEIISDNEVTPDIMKGKAVWVFGRKNSLGSRIIKNLASYDVAANNKNIWIMGKDISIEGHSFVFSVRQSADPDFAMTWIAVDTAEALPGLARKLPHYGKYSFLVFKGTEPANILKGQWKIERSSLKRKIDYPSPPKMVPDINKLPTQEPLALP